jgi:hypothetical protein
LKTTKREKAAGYKKKAAELREAAKGLSETGRTELLAIAEQYEELAAMMEDKRRGWWSLPRQ